MILFDKEEKCCGCAACLNICPRNAIKMITNNDGFIVPEIDVNLCVECSACKRVCDFQNNKVKQQMPEAAYVAINKNKELLRNSASGGVFGAVAEMVLARGGKVFGCTSSNMNIHHVAISKKELLVKLQGSKYVQSDIDMCYREVKKELLNDQWVLFTGTPCQVAGLKSYLGKAFDKLITIDLICHGTPSKAFFNSYIQYLEDKLNVKVQEFKFRDKSQGWKHLGRLKYIKKGQIQERVIYPQTSYYFDYFLRGDVNRESCYVCKYACNERVGDLTIGDYWGIGKVHPEIKIKEGVSLLLVNNKKGRGVVEDIHGYLELIPSNFNIAKEYNTQLREPVVKSQRRAQILSIWRNDGSEGVARYYNKTNRKKIVLFHIKQMIPQPLKDSLKKLKK